MMIARDIDIYHRLLTKDTCISMVVDFEGGIEK
jgi:hypothetical protein